MVRTLRSDAWARFDEIGLANAFRDPANDHHPRTGLVMLENTHAHRMGMPIDRAYTARVAALAHSREVPVHMDGARLLNAAVALRTEPRSLLEAVDSASLCLSKGLGCPAGSVLVGSDDFITEARRARKALGGGQRQIGIVAAAGLVALRRGVSGTLDRLADDHRRARRLATGLTEIEGVDLDPDLVRTNIVILGLDGPAEGATARRDAVVDELGRRGLLAMRYPRARIRCVTHLGVTDPDIESALGTMRAVISDRLSVGRAVA
jgi:threonine aldolase